jgi:hypothetical protein
MERGLRPLSLRTPLFLIKGNTKQDRIYLLVKR